MRRSWILLLLSFVLSTFVFDSVHGALMNQDSSKNPNKCTDKDLESCALTAESLVKDPSLIFPDKKASLDRVCQTWDALTICIISYTKKCYNRDEKLIFDKSFNESIESMTAVCRDAQYRTDYLKYAPCVKNVTTDANFCGLPYQTLITEISNPNVSFKRLCCASYQFKTCILSKTKEVCDPEMSKSHNAPVKSMNISTFAQQVVDKSLSFISKQCSRSRFENEGCAGGDGLNNNFRPNSKGPLNPVNSEQDQLQKDSPIKSTKFQLPNPNKKIASPSSQNSLIKPAPAASLTGLNGIPKGSEEEQGEHGQSKKNNSSKIIVTMRMTCLVLVFFLISLI